MVSATPNETMHLLLALNRAGRRARGFSAVLPRGAKSPSGRRHFWRPALLLHEFLDRFHARRTGGVEACRQTFCTSKLRRSSARPVRKCTTAHLPQKRIAFAEQAQFIGGQNFQLDQLFQRIDLIAIACNPEQWARSRKPLSLIFGSTR